MGFGVGFGGSKSVMVGLHAQQTVCSQSISKLHLCAEPAVTSVVEHILPAVQ